MELLIAHALPPAPVAQAMVNDLPRLAPHLIDWLQRSRVHRREADPAVHFCTPDQAWLIERAGFHARPPQPLGSAWPALALDNPANLPLHQAVWQAMPCHLEVSTSGIALTDPASLNVQPNEVSELHAAMADDLRAAGVSLLSPPERLPWLWSLPLDWAPWAPTPECATGEEIQHWWPQQAGARPWRRLLNLVQMVWHDHPVNLAREASQQLPMNSIWLWGGAAQADLPQPAVARATVRFDELVEPARQGDWHQWQQRLQQLDQERLATLPQTPSRVVLTGADVIVTLEPGSRSAWRRLWPGRRQAWRDAFLAP